MISDTTKKPGTMAWLFQSINWVLRKIKVIIVALLYQPASGKLFSKILFNRLENNIENKNIKSKARVGFWKNHRTSGLIYKFFSVRMANNFVTAFWTSRTYKIHLERRLKISVRKSWGLKWIFLTLLAFCSLRQRFLLFTKIRSQSHLKYP